VVLSRRLAGPEAEIDSREAVLIPDVARRVIMQGRSAELVPVELRTLTLVPATTYYFHGFGDLTLCVKRASELTIVWYSEPRLSA
jgi:hypothetical protein